jgi:hypothetical protein
MTYCIAKGQFLAGFLRARQERCMAITVTSDGVIPLIRSACPSDRGWMAASFSFASNLKCSMAA